MCKMTPGRKNEREKKSRRIDIRHHVCMADGSEKTILPHITTKKKNVEITYLLAKSELNEKHKVENHRKSQAFQHRLIQNITSLRVLHEANES